MAAEAALIASYVHAEVAARRRTYGDFLVITRQKPRLGKYAEAFEICEYGRRPDAAEVKRLFPFLPR